MTSSNCDALIIGGGIVGLSIAHQLLERDITHRICVIDKEPELGLHSSGRNSGVLHAGLYYKPGSTKARVCISGAKRLRAWVEEQGLPINSCGKVIVPQRLDLDAQLDLLAERGRANGAQVQFLDAQQLYELIPEANSISGRALWSPNTAVVKPVKVVATLQRELQERGVRFFHNERNWFVRSEEKQIKLNTGGERISYNHLFNCSGLQADRVAHQFGIGHEYSLLPFKGLYWQLKSNCPIQPRTNLYPVPDLSVPFLGVHFTPSADSKPLVTIGPTATLAWGRENYSGIQALEPSMMVANLWLLTRQYLNNRSGFRRYVHEQAFLALRPLLVRAAQQMIPSLEDHHLEPSQKVGIRSQLFNHKTQNLEDDFICLPGPSSTHVLNAISPAFTASFALADLILERSGFLESTR